MPPRSSQRKRPISFGQNRPGFFHLAPAPRQRPAPKQRQPSARPVPVAHARPAPAANRGGLFNFLQPFARPRPVRAGKHGSLVGHALRTAGERLVRGKQRVSVPGDKRMELIARDTRGPALRNPMFGAELDWRVSDFVKESWAEIKRSTKFTNDPQKKFVAEFKMAVVSAIGQGQIQSAEQLHEFIQEFGKQQGIVLDPNIVEQQLFQKKEAKQLGEIFSSYDKMVRYRKTG